MPIRDNREYRSMPIMKAAEEKRLIDSDFYVEGYATTFNEPYLLLTMVKPNTMRRLAKGRSTMQIFRMLFSSATMRANALRGTR